MNNSRTKVINTQDVITNYLTTIYALNIIYSCYFSEVELLHCSELLHISSQLAFSDVLLSALNWSWLEYLHHKNWQTL